MVVFFLPSGIVGGSGTDGSSVNTSCGSCVWLGLGAVSAGVPDLARDSSVQAYNCSFRLI